MRGSQTPGGGVTGTKGWLQGTIVGRLVTVRAAARQTERPVSAGRLGPAARFPSGFSSPVRPFVCTPPHWPINPLLPTAYLALPRAGAPFPGCGCPWPRRREAGSSGGRSWAQACGASLASWGGRLWGRSARRYLCGSGEGFRRRVFGGARAPHGLTGGACERGFAMRGPSASGNNEKPKLRAKEGPAGVPALRVLKRTD